MFGFVMFIGFVLLCFVLFVMDDNDNDIDDIMKKYR